jgi:hypothetical protein
MRMSIFTAVIGASLAVCGLATAAPKPIAGTEHDPPRFVDESSSSVHLLTQGADGYRFKVSAVVSGDMSKSSAARVDWTQGGKVIVSVKCKHDYSPYDKSFGLACVYDGKPVKAKGAIDALLILADDTDSKEYLLRDFKVNAATYAGGQSVIWQIVPDDLLGAGYAVHIKTTKEDNGKLSFRFWTSTNDGNGVKAQLRCTVDGTKLGDDLDVTLEEVRGVDGDDGETIAEVVPAKGDRKVYKWKHVSAVPQQLKYGKAEDPPKGKYQYLGDHAGAWACDLRKDHNVIRQLAFTVTADGMIDSHPMQQGKNAAPLFPDVALIDMRIPKDSKWDARVRPDAMKKSRGYGLPWPDDPSVKAIQAAFPPASGLPDPQ